MRESMGLTFIIGIIAVFFGIFIIFFTGSLSYSKAFKVKNKIIDIIEEHEIYDSDVADEVAIELKEIGYRVDATSQNDCPATDGKDAATNMVKSGDYHYCVYEHTTDRGTYYKVITYMYFDFPVIGSHLEFSVSGETRILGDKF